MSSATMPTSPGTPLSLEWTTASPRSCRPAATGSHSSRKEIRTLFPPTPFPSSTPRPACTARNFPIRGAGTRLRDRSRSVKLRVLDIARAARSKAKQGQEKLKRAYGQLLNSTGRVAGQAKRFSQEIAAGVKRAADVIQQLTLEGLRDKLDAMVPLVRKVMKQTRARILRGDTRGDGKLVSLFRAGDGNHPQGQGRQADRIRQDGEAAGGGKSDRHRLRGL